MTEMSERGYWRTLSERIAWIPAIRMTRFTTTARTGRFTNRSVNFMDVPYGLDRRLTARGPQSPPVFRLARPLKVPLLCSFRFIRRFQRQHLPLTAGWN